MLASGRIKGICAAGAPNRHLTRLNSINLDGRKRGAMQPLYSQLTGVQPLEKDQARIQLFSYRYYGKRLAWLLSTPHLSPPLYLLENRPCAPNLLVICVFMQFAHIIEPLNPAYLFKLILFLYLKFMNRKNDQLTLLKLRKVRRIMIIHLPLGPSI